MGKSDIKLRGSGGDGTHFFNISLTVREEPIRRSPWNREYKDPSKPWKGYTYPEVGDATD